MPPFKGIPPEAVEGLGGTIAHEILGQSVLFPVFRSLGRLLGTAFNRMNPAPAAVAPATEEMETLPLFSA